MINSPSDISRIVIQTVFQAGEVANEKLKQKKIENNNKTSSLKKNLNTILDDGISSIHASVDIVDEDVQVENVRSKKKEGRSKKEKYGDEFKDPKLGKKINIEM